MAPEMTYVVADVCGKKPGDSTLLNMKFKYGICSPGGSWRPLASVEGHDNGSPSLSSLFNTGEAKMGASIPGHLWVRDCKREISKTQQEKHKYLETEYDMFHIRCWSASGTLALCTLPSVLLADAVLVPILTVSPVNQLMLPPQPSSTSSVAPLPANDMLDVWYSTLSSCHLFLSQLTVAHPLHSSHALPGDTLELCRHEAV